MPVPTPFSRGLRIGSYEVGARLGKGGFGVVHVARDHELGREVAIKFLRPEYMMRTQLVQRFLQEARACAKIGHPGIVTVFEAGIVSGTGERSLDGTAYIVMERLHGESLGDRLQAKGRLSPIGAIGIARQLAAALSVAHTAGIIHRDLKPDNVYLVRDATVVGGERVKILDFGVAKLADPEARENVHTGSQMMLGTPRYMSPEQARAASKVDHRTDIYALGCLLYELVCGKAPFGGDMGDIIVAHQTAPITPPRELVSSIPAALDELIVRMLAKEPENRPPTMQAVDDALDGVYGSIAPTKKRPTPPARSDDDDDKTTKHVAPQLEHAVLATPIGVTIADPPRPTIWWRYRIVVGVGAALLSGLIVYLILRDPSRSQSATRSDAATLVATRDAAVVATTDAAPIAPSDRDADRIVLECKRAQVDKRWADLERCGTQLATTRADDGQQFIARAKSETAAAVTLASLQEALEASDLKRAASLFASIPETSVYRAQASAEYNQTKGPILDGLVAELTAYAGARDCAKHLARLRAVEIRYGTELADEGRLIARPCTQAQASAAAPPPTNDTCEPDVVTAEENRGNAALDAGNYGVALLAYERILKCKPALLRKVYMAACRAKAFDKAKRYFQQFGQPERERLAQICIGQNFDPR